MPVYSIKTIKEYANNYISNNGREITKTVLLITSAVIFVQAVNFFSQVLGLILGLITLTMPQGLVYASLKIVDQQELSAIDDTLYGIKKISKYFTTYFIYSLIAVFVLALVIVAFILLVSYCDIGIIGGRDIVSILAQYWIIVITLLVIVIGTYVFLDCNYGMFPYLMETSDVKNLRALKRSRQFMKHKKKAYLKLYLSFWKEYLGLIIITLLVSFVLPTRLDISAIIFIVGEAVLIKRKLIIYKALFFENSGLDE